VSKRKEMDFREALAGAFRQAMRSRKLTVSAAAKELGISRQSMYKYLTCTATPKSNIVNTACLKWEMSMNVYGITIAAGAFKRSNSAATPRPVQLDFSEILRAVRNRDLEVKLIRADSESLELKVLVKFAS